MSAITAPCGRWLRKDIDFGAETRFFIVKSYNASNVKACMEDVSYFLFSYMSLDEYVMEGMQEPHAKHLSRASGSPKSRMELC